MATKFIGYYSVGSLVTVKASFLNEPAGVIGYVYESYGNAGGISIITQNGKDLGGFSLREQELHLEYYGDTGQVYHFDNVIKLANDYRAGVSNSIFQDVHRFKKSLKQYFTKRLKNIPDENR